MRTTSNVRDQMKKKEINQDKGVEWKKGIYSFFISLENPR
jgi:hypothetical protein